MDATTNQREYWAEYDALFDAYRAERKAVQDEYQEMMAPVRAECESRFRPRLTEIDDRFHEAEKALAQKYGVQKVDRYPPAQPGGKERGRGQDGCSDRV